MMILTGGTNLMAHRTITYTECQAENRIIMTGGTQHAMHKMMTIPIMTKGACQVAIQDCI